MCEHVCMFACVCMPISVYVCMCVFILRSRPFDCHSLSPCLQLTGTQTYTGVFVNLHVRFLSHSLNPVLLSDWLIPYHPLPLRGKLDSRDRNLIFRQDPSCQAPYKCGFLRTTSRSHPTASYEAATGCSLGETTMRS